MVGLLIYVCLSAGGLTLIKIGTGKDLAFSLQHGVLSLQINWAVILGLTLYVASFITSMIVMKTMNLSIFYPTSAGLVYIFVCVISILLLHEKVSVTQLVGMAIILSGIIVMNLKRL